MDIKEATYQYRLNKWTEIVRECRSSGQTITDWCLEHNVSKNSYFYWLKRIRQAACDALPSLNTGNNQIVPLNIPTDGIGNNPKDQETSPAMLLHFGSITLELYNNTSAALIENTIRVLQHVR